MAVEQGATIRSFRLAFDVERRLYKLDRWQIPLAHGLPLRTIAYAALLLLLVLLAGRLPVLGQIILAIPPPLRLLILPGAAAHLLTRIEVDGRPAHRFATSWLRATTGPRRLVAFRPVRSEAVVRLRAITVAPDEHTAEPRPAIVEGPAQVLIRYPSRAKRRGRTLHLETVGTRPMRRGKQISLAPGQRLRVR